MYVQTHSVFYKLCKHFLLCTLPACRRGQLGVRACFVSVWRTLELRADGGVVDHLELGFAVADVARGAVLRLYIAFRYGKCIHLRDVYLTCNIQCEESYSYLYVHTARYMPTVRDGDRSIGLSISIHG